VHLTFQRALRDLSIPGLLIAAMAAAPGALAVNAVPTLSEPLKPVSATIGGAQFTLTVNGAGFVSGAVVNWNGSPRTTQFVNSHNLTATINAADIASPGTAAITVTNPAPGGGRFEVKCSR